MSVRVVSYTKMDRGHLVNLSLDVEDRQLCHNLWSCLEAERAFSRSLREVIYGMEIERETVIEGLDAEQDVLETQMELLHRENHVVKNQIKRLRKKKPPLPGLFEEQDSGGSDVDQAEVEEDVEFRKPTAYLFEGTLRDLLEPHLLGCKVVVYGGPRADELVSGMHAHNIDASYGENVGTTTSQFHQAVVGSRVINKYDCRPDVSSGGDTTASRSCIRKFCGEGSPTIDTSGRDGRPLAIVDVVDEERSLLDVFHLQRAV